MARKSVIAPSVIESERFTDMSIDARALYPHALINADSIGVVVNPRAVARGLTYRTPKRRWRSLSRTATCSASKRPKARTHGS